MDFVFFHTMTSYTCHNEYEHNFLMQNWVAACCAWVQLLVGSGGRLSWQQAVGHHASNTRLHPPTHVQLSPTSDKVASLEKHLGWKKDVKLKIITIS